jgi:cytochrome c peroxidase
MKKKIFVLLFALFLASCSNSSDTADYVSIRTQMSPNTFSGKIDLNKLQNYANQTVPAYITKDNTVGNVITDKGATLGRVLFYDNSLSSTNAVACASCHIKLMRLEMWQW